jgi:hypothetical protein
MTERYRDMTQQEANDSCGPAKHEKVRCPVCDHVVLLHCLLCDIQVTGCLCTAKERMTPQEYENFVNNLKRPRRRPSGIKIIGNL